MYFLSFGCGLKSEKPAIDWQSRVSEIVFVLSEFHSLDAKTPANARPNGHASSGRRVL